MEESELRVTLSRVALGEEPPDTVIANGVLFNAFTREFVPGQSVWIRDGRIAYVGPERPASVESGGVEIDAQGMVILPGLMDAHTHIAYRSGIEEFVRHVIPSGVTTVVTETIELASVVGLDGLVHIVRGLEEQPIRFYYTVPALCGLTEAEEAHAPDNEALRPFLADPMCLGVGEIYWGNLLLGNRQGERVRQLAAMGLDLGKAVEGHTAGAPHRKLQAYSAYGISSCHEPISEEEVLERLRLGYWVMIREGAIRKELEGVQGIFRRDMEFRRLILSTDSMDPEGFLEEGYLDASVRRALKLGVPPGLVYQMVTLNVAEHFHLDDLLGALAPGRMADVVLIPSPGEFSPMLVMREGRILFRDGQRLVEPRDVLFPEPFFHTVNPPPWAPMPLPATGTVRAMELVTRLVTKEATVNLDDPAAREDLLLALAVDRTGGEQSFVGLLKGFGLQRGACGSTMCWDTGDMIVVGQDQEAMRTVVERLRETGGGAVFAVGSEVVAAVHAPLCGIVSLEPMAVLRTKIRRLEEGLGQHGVPWEKPLLTVDTLGTAAIPHLRLTHRGYVRIRDRAVLGLEI